MTRYDFQCLECGLIEEHNFLMSERPDHLDCKCGGRAESMISGNIQVICKGNARPYELKSSYRPIGWEHGNTDCDAQERRYAEIISESKKAALGNQTAAIKNGVRQIARVPREFHRMRTNQYGKDYYETDTKEKLKADGFLYKN